MFQLSYCVFVCAFLVRGSSFFSYFLYFMIQVHYEYPLLIFFTRLQNIVFPDPEDDEFAVLLAALQFIMAQVHYE